MLSAGNIKAPAALIAKLRSPSESVERYLSTGFTPQELDSRTNAASARALAPEVLVQRLNQVLQCDPSYAADRFASVNLSEETRLRLAQNPQDDVATINPTPKSSFQRFPHA